MDENLCPLCGGKMVSRMNRANQSRFWGCASYPDCKGTRNVDGQSAEDRRAGRDGTEDVEEFDPFAPHHFGRWDR